MKKFTKILKSINIFFIITKIFILKTATRHPVVPEPFQNGSPHVICQYLAQNYNKTEIGLFTDSR